MKTYKYIIDGKKYEVEISDIEENIASVKVNGKEYKVEMEVQPEPKKPEHKHIAQPAAVSDSASDNNSNADTANALRAPLPGVVTEILVAVGDKVKKGDTVVVLEAMKMANNLEAEKDGTVTAVCVKQGESVMEDSPLVVIE